MKRCILQEMKQHRPKDIGKACRLLKTSKSALVYKSIKDDSYLEKQLLQLGSEHPREGFWKCYFRLRNQGDKTNHKRMHRIYKKMGLSLRRKAKKRLPQRVKESLMIPPHFTHTWSIDFMSDALSTGNKFRSFNVIDDFNREVLFIEIDYSLKSSRVIWVLRHLINKHGKPQKIRMDNGPEFIAKIAGEFSEMFEIEFKYIEPGKPTQNAFIERFNKSFREGVLDAYLFDELEEVREIADEWILDYNHFRPHDALQGIPPIVYRKKVKENKTNPCGLRSASATPSLHYAHKDINETVNNE